MSTAGVEVRVGFLGAGLIANAHARGLERAPVPYRISAVFDPDTARADSFARRHDAPSVADAAAVIDASDAVYVCTWTSEHRPLVEQVVAAGRAVFCEKPLAKNLADAGALADAVKRAGVVNQVGLVLRHSPAFALMRHLVHEPGAGTVVSMVFRDDQYIPTQGMYDSTWRGDVERAGGGTLLEHSIHDIDLIEHTVDRIDAVNARSAHYHHLRGIEDVMGVTMQLEGGGVASLISIWHDNLARPSLRRVEVFCERRFVSLENDWLGPVSVIDSDGSSRRWEGEELTAAAAPHLPPIANPDHAFLHAVAGGEDAYPGVEVARRAHVVADAVYRSAATHGSLVHCP